MRYTAVMDPDRGRAWDAAWFLLILAEWIVVAAVFAWVIALFLSIIVPSGRACTSITCY